MKTLLLGLLLGLLAAFPNLAAPLADVVGCVAAQPLVWAFVAGLVARPRVVRRISRRIL